MLAVECQHQNQALFYKTSPYYRNKMPVDYASYLLSASPPGFDLAYQFRLDGPVVPTRAVRTPKAIVSPRKTVRPPCYEEIVAYSEECDDLDEVSQGIASLLAEEFQTSKSSRPVITVNQNGNNNKSNKRRVTFADDNGQSLCEIREFKDSATPPSFSSNFLNHLAQDAMTSEELALSAPPVLMLNFSQPASNYTEFRRKLDEKYITLENVILKGYKVTGTIKVKNIAFEKRVRIHGTSDNWNTIIDSQAQYVHNAQSSSPSLYDTFSFSFDVSPDIAPNGKVEFAVVFEANGEQHWDNNNGSNYEIVPVKTDTEEQGKETENPVFDFDHDDRWSEFASWDHSDNTIPYW